MVKTNAPGAFSCEIYLKAWLMGDRRPGCDVMEHIDNCWFCRDIVHGGTEEFPLSIEDEARRNIALRGRRDFLRYAAAVVGGLSLAGMGVASFYGGAPSRVESARSRKFANLDKRLVLFGPVHIRTRLAQKNPNDVSVILKWIVVRKHSQFYGDLVALIPSSTAEISSAATGLAFDIPKIDLQPYASQIDAMLSQQTDPFERAILQKLLDRITSP